MPRIVVSGASPLLVEGTAAALRDADPAWEVHIGSADDEADAWVDAGDELVVRAANGAVAQLAGSATPARLRAALGAVLEGLSVRETPFALDVPPHEPLTPRELEVFELLGKGLSNPDIGRLLGISAHTAKYHVAQILAKIGASTRAEAVHQGLRAGLIGL